MSDAIQIEYPDRLFIGGEWIRPSSAKQLRLVNPADEEIFFEVAEAVQDDVESAVAAARNAFDHGPWPRMDVAERAVLLRKMGEALDQRAGSLENAWVKQIGIPVSMARSISTINEPTIEQKILTSPYEDGSEKCSGSNLQDQFNASSMSTLQPTIISTSNAILSIDPC